MRLASSPANLMNKLLSRVHPLAKAVFGIYDPIGLLYLTQLRVDRSNLNLHKFQHNFRDALNPMFPTSNGIEDAEHFLLQGPSFVHSFIAKVAELQHSSLNFTNLSNEALVELLLYGENDLPDDLHRTIHHLTLCFICETGFLARIVNSVA